MRTSFIIFTLILLCFLCFKYFGKIKSLRHKKDIHNNDSVGNSEQVRIKKNQIKTKLYEIRDKHLTNLINYEICLLYRTELDSKEVREKMIQKFPKTFSRMPFNFSPLFKEFDIKLVDMSILEILETWDVKDLESERKEPFLRFEYFIKQEAKEKARLLFDDFIKQHQVSSSD